MEVINYWKILLFVAEYSTSCKMTIIALHAANNLLLISACDYIFVSFLHSVIILG